MNIGGDLRYLVFGVFLSYLIGSIPTAYCLARLLKGVDIRTVGSGNVGATNALRLLGKTAGMGVLLFDILKGFFVVFFLSEFFHPHVSFLSSETIRILLGLSSITGHIWTVFLSFKGGKGVATTFGVLFGLASRTPDLWPVLILVISVWLVVFILSRIVSLASILTALSLPILAFIFEQSRILFVASFILSGIVIIRHIPNIRRLLVGKESKVTFRRRS